MMKFKICSFLATIVMSIHAGCQASNSRVEEKNECFNERLAQLRNTTIYKTILSAFVDTFAVMKKDKNIFGVSSYVDHKIDEAVFIKKDSSQCLLIVLERMKDSLYVFGSARVVHGAIVDGQWRFDISIEYNFDKEYFRDYPENSFENIAKLARYGILVRENANQNGCEINETYWFPELR